MSSAYISNYYTCGQQWVNRSHEARIKEVRRSILGAHQHIQIDSASEKAPWKPTTMEEWMEKLK